MEDINHDFFGQNAPLGKLLARIEYLEIMVLTLSQLSGIDVIDLKNQTMSNVTKNRDERSKDSDDDTQFEIS